MRTFVPSSAATGLTFGTVDATDGSTYVERMRLTSGGNLGIGGTPSYRLDVRTDAATYAAQIFNDGNNANRLGLVMQVGADSGGTGTLIQFLDGDGTDVGEITFNGTTTTYSTSSDQRLKDNIVDTQFGLDDLMNVQVRDYIFNTDGTGALRTGFIAQELNAVYPEAVVASDDPNEYWSVDYGRITPLIVKAVQELNYKVDNALLTINEEGMSDLTVNKITVASDIKVGGLVSASNFALDASALNRTGSLASVPVSNNKVTVADALNSLSNHQSLIINQVSGLASKQASQSAQLAEAKILGEQAISHAETLDDKVASTSANLSSLSSRIDELLASISGDTSEASDSSAPSNPSDLTPPSELIATDSATFAFDPSVTSVTLDTLVASNTLKSLGDTFLGNTTIAGDLSVDGTLSFTGNAINALPTLFFQNGPLAQAVDFFSGKVTINKDGLFATEAIALGDESLGEAIIPAGQIEITIPSSLVNTTSKIFLTPTSAITGNLYPGTIQTSQSFKVKISTPNLSDVKFNWMIVQNKEASN